MIGRGLVQGDGVWGRKENNCLAIEEGRRARGGCIVGEKGGFLVQGRGGSGGVVYCRKGEDLQFDKNDEEG